MRIVIEIVAVVRNTPNVQQYKPEFSIMIELDYVTICVLI